MIIFTILFKPLCIIISFTDTIYLLLITEQMLILNLIRDDEKSKAVTQITSLQQTL